MKTAAIGTLIVIADMLLTVLVVGAMLYWQEIPAAVDRMFVWLFGRK